MSPGWGDGGVAAPGGSELDKPAGNTALFRNAAGVHWRGDPMESLLRGASVVIGLLQERSLAFNEHHPFFQFTKLDGAMARPRQGPGGVGAA